MNALTHPGLNLDPDPRKGPKNVSASAQTRPGSDAPLAADHGETSYQGTGRLKGKRALITGADSGIGRAIAIAFAREGADVAISYLNEHDDARETLRHVKECGHRSLSLPGDLTDRERCRDLISQTREAFGGIDVLVNNAATQHQMKTLADLKAKDLEETFRTNFFAYVYTTQAALEVMKEGAVILNTTSVNALKGMGSLMDYSATKAAILNFTKSLAPEIAPRGIRVNAVAPGPVWTPLIPSTMPDQAKNFGSHTLWERPAQPIEIATSFVFLASEDARYFTGQVLSPTGTTEGAR